MNDLITWLITIITFLLGYYLGKGSINKDGVDNLWKTLNKPFKDNRVGAIQRPTAEKLLEKNDPILRGSNEAMRESLKDLPK